LETRLFAVVEDYSDGISMAGAQTADAVTQIHSVGALRTLHRAVTYCESHPVALMQAYHLGSGLHSGPLFRQDKFSSSEVFAGF
jgi:hypothetical protein